MKKFFSIIALLVTMIGTASAGNNLSVACVDGRLSISMDNDVTVKAYDFHLYLPDGAAIGKYWDEDDEEYVTDVTLKRVVKAYQLTLMKDSKDGSFLFGVSCSDQTKSVKESSGEIMNMSLDLSTVSDGKYNCALKTIWFAQSGSEGVAVDDVNFEIEVADGKLSSVITGIEDVVAEKSFNADGKYLKDGKIIIKKGGKEYNTVGTIAK